MINKVKIFVSTILILAVSACSNLDESELRMSTDGKVLYSETFSTSQGDFTTYSVKGDQNWTFSATYSCMVISGYVNPTNYENEDWLISPEVNLGDYTTSHISFEHAGNYFASVSSSVSVWVSENYITGTRPDSVSWTQLEITKSFSNSDFNFVTPEISLTQFAGKKVRIAFKYNSTTTKAGTWELKNFKVLSGEATPVPVVDNGKGTELSPYNVAGASQATGTLAWVNAYVVGYLWSGTYTNYVLGADTCTQATNLMIADTTGNIYFAKCMAVQLPTGVIRNALNLVTPANKTLIGKKVRLYGSIESYFGAPGIKTVTYAVMPDGTEVGIKPIDYSKSIFYESFAASLGNFTTYSVTGAQAWVYNSQYKCAIMNGYASGSRYVNDDWLISPTIDLSTVTNEKVVLNFTMAGKYFYGSINKNCSLYISTDYVAGEVSSATWTKLSIPKYDTSDNFTWTQSGDVDLTAYKGNSNVRLAIQYTSDGTTTGTGQLEIKNFVVY